MAQSETFVEPGPPRPRVGLGIAATPFADPRTFWRWVDLCEASDVDSLWQTDRIVSREPYLEALSTMAAVAGATSRMRFGMNAVVVSVRDPVLLAKQCATIDFLSGGRLLPVFGVGAETAPEWKAMGRSPRGRGRRADEALQILRRLWTEEAVDHDGEFYTLRGASIAPRPVQSELPLWIGGHSEAAIRRTARIGTGWLAGILPAGKAGPVVEAIRREAASLGRRIPEDHYGAGFPFRFGSWDDPDWAGFARARLPGGVSPRDYAAVGDARTILERIEAYRREGISKFVLIPLARGDADLLEQTRRLAHEVLPVVHSARPPADAG
jgi:probable F420-dependent oxidoreductase